MNKASFNLKKARLLVALMMCLSAVVIGCGGRSDSKDNLVAEDDSIYTVDHLNEHKADLVGKKVTIEGDCMLFGKCYETRIFIKGSADSIFIRCDATASMGGLFTADHIGKRMRVTGLLQEKRIDEHYLKQKELQFSSGLKNMQREGIDFTVGEDMRRISELVRSGGMQLTDFKPTDPDSAFRNAISQTRNKIAERELNEGKSYLSYYYIDVIDYQTVE